LSKAKGDYQKAIHIFKQELSVMREVSDIKTICMHGNPLSKYNDRELWKTYDFLTYGIVGEAFISIHNILYFTDTGRSWDMQNNIRDKCGHCGHVPGLKKTDDLIDYIKIKSPLCIYLSNHPERWASTSIDYYAGCFQDFAINCGKSVLSRRLK
jgi:hypothetical protein